VLHQFALKALDLTSPSAIILPKLDRTGGTVQFENRFALAADHVNVSRSMIVGIDCNPKTIKPENRRHKLDDITILSG
jgi:hypothetical protein